MSEKKIAEMKWNEIPADTPYVWGSSVHWLSWAYDHPEASQQQGVQKRQEARFELYRLFPVDA